MTDPRVIALLRALPEGKTVWLSAEGMSLWPMIQPGDSLELTRSSSGGLALGDVAVVQQGSTLIAHIVVEVRPVRTASIVGVLDAEGLEALARVSAVRRGGATVRVPRGLNRLVRHLPAAALLAKRVPGLRGLVRRLRG